MGVFNGYCFSYVAYLIGEVTRSSLGQFMADCLFGSVLNNVAEILSFGVMGTNAVKFWSKYNNFLKKQN